jgi:hypothetical protein
MFRLLLKRVLKPLRHLTDHMLPPIERKTILEYQPHIPHKLLHRLVSRTTTTTSPLAGTPLGGIELTLDRTEIHGVFDDARVVRDVESDGVDGGEEGYSVFGFLERSDDAYGEFLLVW